MHSFGEFYWNFLELNFSLRNYFVWIKFGVKSISIAVRLAKVRCTLFRKGTKNSRKKNFSPMFGISANIFQLLVDTKPDVSAAYIPDFIHSIEGWSCCGSQESDRFDKFNIIIYIVEHDGKTKIFFFLDFYPSNKYVFPAPLRRNVVQCVAFDSIEYEEKKKVQRNSMLNMKIISVQFVEVWMHVCVWVGVCFAGAC